MKANNLSREVADIIWKKLKGRSVPDTYSEKEIEDIVTKYWHRAMESEQSDS